MKKKPRANNRRDEMRASSRKELELLFQTHEFVDWEQRDVMREFMIEQSVSNTPGIIRRLGVYVAANYPLEGRPLDDKAKAEILEDFRLWSGGFIPGDCDDETRNKYLEFALSKEFKRSDVATWFDGLEGSENEG